MSHSHTHDHRHGHDHAPSGASAAGNGTSRPLLLALLLTGSYAGVEALAILGLSLANWAGLAFLGCLVIAAWALIRCRRSSRRA